ncbi:IS256 family transposase [Dissulfurispira thermophila]|uniref:Mutator family transposase n=1 Tax=Dissulfurispira thermophila TaxID=2715679 RepID=A0A7G1H0K3_9BACT|nr:IS256 family transposase [Dissulfurispira thermophila]
MMEMGRMVAEAIMYIDREETAGPEYKPFCPNIYKWASQPGSVYIADQKVRVERPRLRGRQGEIQLKSYKRMKEPDGFSEELLAKVLRGISCQKYAEIVIEAAQAFGVSPSTVSRHIIEATGKQLKEFKERSLSDLRAFAIYLDTIHRAGEAFIIALGIDTEGKKMPLGSWQGATENYELCEELLADIERRGLKLTKRTIWVTDGGKGIIKALRDKFGKKLLHQRCTIHKDKNIQKHLAKRYRKEAHRRFKTALEQKSYEDAKEMLLEMEKWLRGINESAADSLLEAIEEILTLHRLKVPELLRKTLCSTNPIESMFSMVRDAEGNIKRYRNSRMKQRWLASVLLYCEKRFKRVNGYTSIPDVIRNIEALEETGETVKVAA